MKIAIIDDDINLALNIWKNLKRNWYEVIISNNFEDFKKNVLDNADLFIVDLDLWVSSWFEIIEWLRFNNRSSKPIIIMSCYDDIDTKIKWYSMWIDDYICKPVNPMELQARIWALIRRWTPFKNPKVTYWKFIFDFESKQVYKWDFNIKLTRKEYQIVEFLLLNRGKIIAKDSLIKSIWWKLDLLDVTYNTINVTICKIRRKLWEDFDIETHSWIWYILR